MTRSRLRRPTSKSTTTTFLPIFASAAPSAAVDVVLPTPPLPEVTTRTLAIVFNPPRKILAQRRHRHRLAFEPRLNGAAAILRVHVLCRAVEAVDGDQLGFELVAEDARRRIAGGAGNRAAAERAVDVDRSPGDDFRAG